MSKPHMSRKSEIIYDFLDVDRDGLLTLTEMMAFPKYLQNVKGKAELGKRLADVYQGVWERINEAIGKPKSSESLAKKDFITGTDIVRETEWFRETFVKETTDIYFDSIGLNSDDVITLKEWREFYECRHPVNEEFTKATFRKVDTNGDGKITREEFKKAFAKFSVSDDPTNDFSFLYDINKIRA